jgi:transposase-like zinc-binding protein
VNRPLLEVADIVHAAGQRLIEQRPAWLTWLHRKVLRAIELCRTAALGGHVDECSRCGYRVISFNSCLMGSLSLWGVGRQKGMLQHCITPFRLSIKTWPSR